MKSLRKSSTSAPGGHRPARAFSLLELVVVVGLIGVLAVVFLGGFGGRGTVPIHSAQALVANLLAAARLRAVTKGDPTRVLVNVGSPQPARPRRYLRHLVLQELTADGTWQGVADADLPEGVAVVPPPGLAPANLLVDPGAWTKADGTSLTSSALTELAPAGAVAEFPDDAWGMITFSAAGLPDPAGGCVILARARTRPAGGEPPVELDDATDLCGVLLSRYGVPLFLNCRADF